MSLKRNVTYASCLIAVIPYLAAMSSCTSTNEKLRSSPAPVYARINTYMQRTNSRETERCMRKLGFKYLSFVPSYGSPPIAVVGEPVRGKDSYSLLALKKSWSNPPNNPNDPIRDSLSPIDREAYDTALNGPNRKTATGQRGPTPESCAGKGTASSYEIERRITSISAPIRARFDQQPDVIKYRKQWAACMKAFGYQYSTRSDLVLGLLNEYNDLNKLEAAESEAAKRDHTCISESDETAFQERAQRAIQTADITFFDR